MLHRDLLRRRPGHCRHVRAGRCGGRPTGLWPTAHSSGPEMARPRSRPSAPARDHARRYCPAVRLPMRRCCSTARTFRNGRSTSVAARPLQNPGREVEGEQDGYFEVAPGLGNLSRARVLRRQPDCTSSGREPESGSKGGGQEPRAATAESTWRTATRSRCSGSRRIPLTQRNDQPALRTVAAAGQPHPQAGRVERVQHRLRSSAVRRIRRW